MRPDTDELTVIIPVFNESSALNSVINDLDQHFSNERLLFINDGSNDDSQLILENSKKNFIQHEANLGYGASLKTGVLSTTTKYVAFFDADGQHRAADLVTMFEHLNGNSMIVGARGVDSHQVRSRILGKKVLSATAEFLCKRKIPDLNSGLRILETNTIKPMLSIMPDGFSFSTTSTIAFHQLSFGVKYHPIVVNARTGTSTVIIFSDGLSTLALIFRLIMLFEPLRIFLPLSGFFLILTAISFSLNLVEAGGNVSEPTIFFALATILIFLLGLISDQIVSVRKFQVSAYRDALSQTSDTT